MRIKATICLGKLQGLAGSSNEAACAQSIRNSFVDVSAPRSIEMYEELFADAKHPRKILSSARRSCVLTLSLPNQKSECLTKSSKRRYEERDGC
jgi:hypothetical protein